MEFEAGRIYPVKIEFGEKYDFAGLHFKWRKISVNPDQKDEINRTLKLASDADVIIACCGISPRLEGEEMPVDEPGFKGGDRTSLNLPDKQHELLRALYATGKPVSVFID